MPQSIGEPSSNPKTPDLKVRIPTVDELMRLRQPPPWWEFLPPPARPSDSPYAPVPIIPLPPPPTEVDPPSRPPEWLFGPPYISDAPMRPSSFGPAHAPPVRPDYSARPGDLAERITALKRPLRMPDRSSAGAFRSGVPAGSVPMQGNPGGILGMMSEAGHIDPSNPDRPPHGGLLGLMQEYLRNNKGGAVGS